MVNFRGWRPLRAIFAHAAQAPGSCDQKGGLSELQLSGRIEGVVDGILRGWAWNAANMTQRLDLEVLADGKLVGVHQANRPRGDLRRSGIGDGAHGLECPLPLELRDGAEHVFELRFKTDAGLVEVARQVLIVERRKPLLHGKLERVDAHEAVGWIADRAEPGATVSVELLIHGKVAAIGLANLFRRDLLNAGIGAGAHGFVFDLSDVRSGVSVGATIAIRAGAEFGHWVLGAATLPNAPTATRPPELTDAGIEARRILNDAREAEKRRDFVVAARLADEGLSAAPQNFDLLVLRARVALALNDVDEAVRFANAAQALHPGHVRPIVILARAASSRGEHAKAVELWSAVRPGMDNYRERLIKRGRSLSAVGRPLEALSEFSAAIKLDATDRDAQRGMAEVSQAIGALHVATRHWRRYGELAPGDGAVEERLLEIAQRKSRPEALPSPLRNPTLHAWRDKIDGVAGVQGVEPTPSVRLRSLIDNATLAFTVAARCEIRPSDSPVYGLWLNFPDGGAEIAFALDSAARTDLVGGLRMGVELDAHAQLTIQAWLLNDDGAGRQLSQFDQRGRLQLQTFDLRLNADEAPLLEEGKLWLALRTSTPGAFRLFPPRPIRRLASQEGQRSGFEDSALAVGIAKLNLGAAAFGAPVVPCPTIAST